MGKSVVVFGGMSDESDFKSMRPDDANQIGLIWFEEASHILPNATRQEAIEATEEIINSFGRSKNDTGIKVLFTYNPPSPTHWLADKYHNREQLLDDEQLIVTTQEDNPHLTEEYKRSFDKWKVIWPEYWAQQVEGKMLETGLKCYPTVMQNVVPRVETSINRICIGVDLGIDDATTFVATAMNSDYSNMVVVACYEHSNHGIRNNDLRKDFTDYANDFVNFYNSLKITYPGVIIEIYIDSETRGEMFRKLLKKRQIFGKLIVKNKIEERIIKTNILLRNGNLKLIQSLPIVNALANATRNTESTNKDDWIRVQNRETHLIDAFEYSIISKLNHIKILEGE